LDPGVAALLMTALGLVIAALVYAVPKESNRIIVWGCVVVAGIAGLAAWSLGHRVYRKTVGHVWIRELIIEGRELAVNVPNPITAYLNDRLVLWCSNVEEKLGKYLDQTAITRFRVHGQRGPSEHPDRMQWWEIQSRLMVLEELLKETA
jgi:hypothetical protein